jgi:hypothetical protein
VLVDELGVRAELPAVCVEHGYVMLREAEVAVEVVEALVAFAENHGLGEVKPRAGAGGQRE